MSTRGSTTFWLALLYACASPEADLVAVHLPVGQRRPHGTSSGIRGRCWSSWVVPTWRWPSDARYRSSGPWRSRSRRRLPAGSATRSCLSPGGPVRPLRPSSSWPRPAPAGRDHAGHPRSAHQPRHRAADRARLPRLLRLGRDGRRVPRAGQHHAHHGVEHPLRPGGGEDRPRRLAGCGGRGPAGAARACHGPRRHGAGADLPCGCGRAGGAGRELGGPCPDPDQARIPARRAAASDPVIAFVADALRYYFEFHARYDGFYGAFIHDPLVTAVALDPDLAGPIRRPWTWTRPAVSRTGRRSPTGGGSGAARRTRTWRWRRTRASSSAPGRARGRARRLSRS